MSKADTNELGIAHLKVRHSIGRMGFDVVIVGPPIASSSHAIVHCLYCLLHTESDIFTSAIFFSGALQLVHGWRVYDYVAYQKYRFSVRQHRWMMRNETLDESIAEPMQTLDLLCFSSQARKQRDQYFLFCLTSL